MKKVLPFLAALAMPLPAAGDLFAPGSKWDVVTDGHRFAEGMAFDFDGHFLFTDVPNNQLFRIDGMSGKKSLVDGASGRANGIIFGPEGALYGCSSGDEAIYAWDPATWKKKAVTRGTASNDIAVLEDGTLYYTDPKARTVWRVSPAPDRKREAAAVLGWGPNGIGAGPDGETLYVAEFASARVHGFPIKPDRTLGTPAVIYTLKVPQDGSGKLDGLEVLPGGRLLIGTALGIQMAHPDSEKVAPQVIPSPGGRPRCNYVRLTPDGLYLYAAFGKDILRRKVNAAALFPGE
ncbi:MAG: SMP-30/gluconolactonase/LRE family protein [Akkermansiaceae bacterium]|nr:SMP-30/gluconolactonase/LRE family protein [Akkermansiaceae bacterium]